MAVEAKICGLTRPADAAAAADYGASCLGVVFASGPRRVDHTRALEVVRAAQGLPVFGVFVEAGEDEILRARDATGIRGVQLHGDYSARVAARLRREGLVVWRVARLAGPADLAAVAEAVDEADAVLVEPRVPRVAGGSGTALDLRLARTARQALVGRRMVLAGGLMPESVADAVALVEPETVDVSSGVELRPGIKDHNKLARFLEVTRGARAGC